ncbi:MAG: hypothetical protein IJ629_03140 [Clostridia bacterium]|nr:hypothetical protein [Clostridia bacterium]
MKKRKIISCLILIGIVLALPSVAYLVRNTGNMAEYAGEFFYMIGISNKNISASGVVVYAWSVLLMFLIYLRLIKVSEQFKKCKKYYAGSACRRYCFCSCFTKHFKRCIFLYGKW